jgi:hypothetical protein
MCSTISQDIRLYTKACRHCRQRRGGVWIRFLFLWALTTWCVSIFQRRPGGYAATKKRQKITQLIAAKQEKLSFIFPKG